MVEKKKVVFATCFNANYLYSMLYVKCFQNFDNMTLKLLTYMSYISDMNWLLSIDTFELFWNSMPWINMIWFHLLI